MRSFPCAVESDDVSLLLCFVCNKIEVISFLIISGGSCFFNQVDRPIFSLLLLVKTGFLVIHLNYHFIKINVELVWMRVSKLI